MSTPETEANLIRASDRELRVWATPLSEEAVREAEALTHPHCQACGGREGGWPTVCPRCRRRVGACCRGLALHAAGARFSADTGRLCTACAAGAKGHMPRAEPKP